MRLLKDLICIRITFLEFSCIARLPSICNYLTTKLILFGMRSFMPLTLSRWWIERWCHSLHANLRLGIFFFISPPNTLYLCDLINVHEDTGKWARLLTRINERALETILLCFSIIYLDYSIFLALDWLSSFAVLSKIILPLKHTGWHVLFVMKHAFITFLFFLISILM